MIDLTDSHHIAATSCVEQPDLVTLQQPPTVPNHATSHLKQPTQVFFLEPLNTFKPNPLGLCHWLHHVGVNKRP